MKTIQEIFAENLRRIRGNRSQSEMAEYLGLPMRSYQNLEYGRLPQRATLDAIIEKLGVSESQLFNEFKESNTALPPEYEQVARLAAQVAADKTKSLLYESLSPTKRRILELLSTLDEPYAARVLRNLEIMLEAAKTRGSALVPKKNTKKSG